MGVKEITTLGLCLLATVSSVSLPPRRWYSETVDGPEACVRLEHKCNSVFNRSATEAYTKLPNDRGLTLEASIFEFSEFDQLLQQNCSSSLWTLLCFYYFPQCNPNYSLKHVVTPCREQCVEAKRHCEPLLLRYNASWPEHLECSKFNRHSDDRLCINRAPNPALIDRVLNPPPVAPTTTSTTTVSSSSVAATTSSSIIPSPTPLPPSVECQRCNYRRRANGGTFKRNNFAFAANVTLLDLIQSIDEYNTYLAEVTQMWIIDSQNCSVNTPLFYILVRTSYTDCELCPAMDTDSGESGHENVYLIGGYCTDRGWYLPPNDSLASKWYSHSKYQTKMDEWVESGRQSRNLN